MKKEIAFFGPYPPPHGGIAIFMSNLYNLLSPGNECLKFIVFTKGAVDKRNITRLTPRPWYIFQWIVHLFSVKVCLDLNEFCFEYPNWKLAFIWFLLKKIYRFKWIKMIHNGSLPERFKTFNSQQRNTFYRMLSLVDEMIVVNEELANWLKYETGYKKKVTIIGSLLPDDTGPNEDIILDENINDFLKNHDKTVLSIGVFDKLYGFHDIANVIENIRNQGMQNLGLILIDGAFINDPNYENMVLGNRDWILKLSQVDHKSIKGIIKACDLLIRSTKYESYGLSRIEALICNKPVIATNVGEIRGMYLFEYGDHVTLKKQVETVLQNSDQEYIKKWSRFYEETAHKNFNLLLEILFSDKYSSGKKYKL